MAAVELAAWAVRMDWPAVCPASQAQGALR
jgi:hypothetical protein